MQRIKKELARQGLRPADLPAAIVVHELLGACMALGFWSACYAIQPASTVLAPVARAAAGRTPALAGLWERSLHSARARVSRAAWIRARTGADPARLTLALAESLVVRAVLKPGTFVFKLWASAALVRVAKTAAVSAAGGAGRPGRVACVSLAALAGGPGRATRAVRRPCPWSVRRAC
jgi:hypothetical protein